MVGFRGLINFEILEETMNGERYCELLQEKVIPFFSRELNRNMWFQQDGALAHYFARAWELLENKMAGRWIGRRGAIE